MSSSDPFSDWSALLNRPVFSSDRKKLGFLRSVINDHLVVKRGLINLSNYLIPKAAAESVDRNGIRLRISAYEARRRYTYAKMKRLAVMGHIPRSAADERIFRDRLQTLRYSTTRNRLAAGIAFVSGILFLLSGYRANIAIYSLVREQLVIHTAPEFWSLAIIPIGALALLAQLGGITVLMGAGLFAANRVNIGKALVMIGTGQGLTTILLRLATEFWSGRFGLDNNYVLWLTSSAAGLGVIFAVVSQTISKGKGQSISTRLVRRLLGR